MAIPLNFGALNIAATAVAAHQHLIQVIEHNVANASTPGYSRQQGILQTTTPFPVPGFPSSFFAGQLGSGVQVSSVTRFRLDSLENVFRRENTNLGNLTGASQLLQQIEAVFGEPGTSGVSSLLGSFFQSVQNLSQEPDDLTRRNAVLQAGGQLANGIHALNDSLLRVITNANTEVSSLTTKINNLSTQIADLNKQIRLVQSSGQNANDLLDRRGELIGQLSKLVNINVAFQTNGSSIVSIGGVFLVQDDQVNTLSNFTDAQGRVQVQFANLPATPVPLTSGQLFGVINTRDNVLGNISTPGTIYNRLNQVAFELVRNFNSRHQLGYTLTGATNVFFFNPDPDGDGDVDAGIGVDVAPLGSTLNWLSGINVNITDPRMIAASAATVQSVQNINNLAQTIQPDQTLLSQSAAFQIAPTPTGTIVINGVSIAWTPTQTINQVLQNINSSGAGVVASFDSATQRVLLRRDTSVNQTYLGPGIPSPAITVNDTIGNLSNVFLINTVANPPPFPTAISTTGTPGDGTNLSFLFRLQNESLVALGSTSVTRFYNQIVADLGTRTSQAQTNLNAEQGVLQQLEQQRQDFSGVNLNEEALALAKAQQSFNAAARMVTTIDDLLNKIINGTGRVGL